MNNKLSEDEIKQLCKQLRIETGCGLMCCKKALYKNDLNLENAKDYLNRFYKKPYILY